MASQIPPTLPTDPTASANLARVPAPAPSSFSNLGRLFWRHRWVTLGCMVAVVGLVAIYTWRTSPVYDASTMLRFEHSQVNLPQLVEQVVTETRISTEIELLQGRTAAETVIDSLGLRAEVVSPRHARVTTLFPVLRVDPRADTATLAFRVDHDGRYAAWNPGNPLKVVHARLGEPLTIAGVTLALSRAAVGLPEIRLQIGSTEAALKRFKAALRVTRPARDADLILVNVEASDPENAARAANLLAEHLIQSRRTELQSRGALAMNFLRAEVDTLGTQLRVAEDTLRRYRERAKAVDPTQQASTQVVRMAQIGAERGGLDAERSALAAVMQQIKVDAAAAPEAPSPYRRLIGFPALLKNQAAAELLSSLAALENERSVLLRRRTWQDDDVKSLSVRIRGLDDQLHGIATTYLEGMTGQVAGLDRVSRQFGLSLDSLPTKAIQTARLERDASILTSLYTTMQTRLKEEQVTQAMQDPAMRIVDKAYAADEPLRPRPAKNLAIALVLGTLIGLSVSLGRAGTDRSIRSRADVLQASGHMVLGALPRLPNRLGSAAQRLLGKAAVGRNRITSGSVTPMLPAIGSFATPTNPEAAALARHLVPQAGASGPYAEAFSQLQADLALAFQDRPLNVLVFTSPLPGEGKTLTAINYALTTALSGQRVLLIDADTRCGIINQVFGCRQEPGLTELLARSVAFEDAMCRIVVNPTTSIALLPTGGLLAGPPRRITLERLQHVVRAIRNQFDVIVIDSPPLNLLADATLLSAVADGVIVVARAGQTRREALAFAMDRLLVARAPVIGVVLNDVDLDRSRFDDGSYEYLAGAEKYYAAT